jgi:hypothetical protein
MTRLVNLVGTVCKDGNLAALRAWYVDHVHQLFADPGLLEARLAMRVGAGLGSAPECLCFYDFASAEAFEAYERGPVRASAAVDRASSWGRDGIEITLRYPLVRQYRRVTSAPLLRWRVSAFEADAATERRVVAALDGALELYRTQVEPGRAPSTLLWTEPGVQLPGVMPAPAWQAEYAFTTIWSR